MTACMLHSYFWIFLSWFMHALFTSCSPVLAQHASSKFDVPLMTPGGCGQWVQACRLSGRVSEWWKPCDMSETPSHQAPKLSHCDALTPSHHISPHATAFQAALPLDLCRRGVVCFVSGFGLRFGECCDMASRGIPWRAVSQVQSLIWEAKERPEKTVTTDAADVQKTNSHY